MALSHSWPIACCSDAAACAAASCCWCSCCCLFPSCCCCCCFCMAADAADATAAVAESAGRPSCDARLRTKLRCSDNDMYTCGQAPGGERDLVCHFDSSKWTPIVSLCSLWSPNPLGVGIQTGFGSAAPAFKRVGVGGSAQGVQRHVCSCGHHENMILLGKSCRQYCICISINAGSPLTQGCLRGMQRRGSAPQPRGWLPPAMHEPLLPPAAAGTRGVPAHPVRAASVGLAKPSRHTPRQPHQAGLTSGEEGGPMARALGSMRVPRISAAEASTVRMAAASWRPRAQVCRTPTTCVGKHGCSGSNGLEPHPALVNHHEHK